MKSTKIFFIGIVVLCICLFAFDLLKATVFLTHHHALVIKLRTIFFVCSTVALMLYMLDKKSFKVFIVGYLALFVLYFIINSKLTNAKDEFMNLTQLFTPLPVIFFWIINKAVPINKETNKSIASSA